MFRTRKPSQTGEQQSVSILKLIANNIPNHDQIGQLITSISATFDKIMPQADLLLAFYQHEIEPVLNTLTSTFEPLQESQINTKLLTEFKEFRHKAIAEWKNFSTAHRTNRLDIIGMSQGFLELTLAIDSMLIPLIKLMPDMIALESNTPKTISLKEKIALLIKNDFIPYLYHWLNLINILLLELEEQVTPNEESSSVIFLKNSVLLAFCHLFNQMMCHLFLMLDRLEINFSLKAGSLAELKPDILHDDESKSHHLHVASLADISKKFFDLYQRLLKKSNAPERDDLYPYSNAILVQRNKMYSELIQSRGGIEQLIEQEEYKTAYIATITFLTEKNEIKLLDEIQKQANPNVLALIPKQHKHFPAINSHYELAQKRIEQRKTRLEERVRQLKQLCEIPPIAPEESKDTEEKTLEYVAQLLKTPIKIADLKRETKLEQKTLPREDLNQETQKLWEAAKTLFTTLKSTLSVWTEDQPYEHHETSLASPDEKKSSFDTKQDNSHDLEHKEVRHSYVRLEMKVETYEKKLQAVLDPIIYVEHFSEIKEGSSTLSHLHQALSRLKKIISLIQNFENFSKNPIYEDRSPVAQLTYATTQLNEMAETSKELSQALVELSHHPLFKQFTDSDKLIHYLESLFFKDPNHQPLFAALKADPFFDWVEQKSLGWLDTPSPFEGWMAIVDKLKVPFSIVLPDHANGVKQLHDLTLNVLALDQDELKPPTLWTTAKVLFKNKDTIGAVLQSKLTLQKKLKTETLKKAQQLNLVFRALALSIDKIELENFTKKGYIADFPLKGNHSFSSIVKKYQALLKSKGYVFKEEEHYPFTDAILKQRRALLVKAQAQEIKTQVEIEKLFQEKTNLDFQINQAIGRFQTPLQELEKKLNQLKTQKKQLEDPFNDSNDTTIAEALALINKQIKQLEQGKQAIYSLTSYTEAVRQIKPGIKKAKQITRKLKTKQSELNNIKIHIRFLQRRIRQKERLELPSKLEISSFGDMVKETINKRIGELQVFSQSIWSCLFPFWHHTEEQVNLLTSLGFDDKKQDEASLLPTRLDARLNRIGQYSHLRDQMYLLYEGETGEVLKSVRYEGMTKRDMVATVTAELVMMKDKREAVWNSLFANCLEHENIIQALASLKSKLEKPGYKLRDALEEIKIEHPDYHHLLFFYQYDLLVEIQAIQKHFHPGEKVIDYVPPIPEPLIQEDKKLAPLEDKQSQSKHEEILLARIKSLTEARWAFWPNHSRDATIHLLGELKEFFNQNESAKLEEALNYLKIHSPHKDHLYLLWYGETGALLKQIESSELSKQDIVDQIDGEILRLRKINFAPLWFFRQCRKAAIEEQIQALLALKDQLNNNGNVELSSTHKAILDKYEAGLMMRLDSVVKRNSVELR